MDQSRENRFAEQQALLSPVHLAVLCLASLAIWIAFSQFTIHIHNDDAMRLVQVRDLLAGQGWHDLTQYRLGLEGGTAMHWSRIVDAPIAGLILLAQPLVGTAQAEAFAMTVWPGFLFALTIFALGAICHRLGGAKATIYGVILASILVAQSSKFDPGSLDHHNVQIMLLCAGLAGFIYRRVSAGYAVMAGAALGVSIGVGVENLPQIAMVCIAFALVWAWHGMEERDSTLAFAMTLFAALGLVFWGMAPAEAHRGGFCDAISFDLVLPGFAATLGLSALNATLSEATRKTRFLGLACMAAGVAALVYTVAPACLSNPLDSLDPVLKEKWLSRVGETQPLRELSNDRLGFFAGGVIGLMIAIWFMLRDLRWEAWGLLSATIAVSLAFASFQSRGFPMVAALSILPTAALAARLTQPGREHERAWSVLVMLCAVILSVPSFTSAVVTTAAGLLRPAEASAVAPAMADGPVTSSGVPCTSATDLAGLAALPVGVVSAPPYFGSHILMHTPHRTLSAPYHRNQAGMLAQLDLAYADPTRTHDLLKTYGVTYVVVCEGDQQFAGENPGLWAHVGDGAASDFLIRSPGAGPLAIYRVK